MNDEQVLQGLATIASNGAVLLGNCLTCDAHFSRPIRVITHIHWDHLDGLKESLRECEAILMTPLSKEFLTILKGKKVGNSEKIKAVLYGDQFSFQDERIIFYPSGHIFGSAQVLLNTKDGVRIVYTGDFKYPPAHPVACDVLITEATYGHPERVREFEPEVEERFIDLVKESLLHQPVWILGFHGKLQKILTLLTKGKISVPAVLPSTIFQMAQVCEKHGIPMGKYVALNSPQGSLLIKKQEPCVILSHAMAAKNIPSWGVKILLSGWEFQRPIRKQGKDKWLVALSDHADFTQLLAYVEQCCPRLVLTDNYRVGDAVTLAREIEKRLNIPARALPV